MIDSFKSKEAALRVEMAIAQVEKIEFLTKMIDLKEDNFNHLVYMDSQVESVEKILTPLRRQGETLCVTLAEQEGGAGHAAYKADLVGLQNDSIFSAAWGAAYKAREVMVKHGADWGNRAGMVYVRVGDTLKEYLEWELAKELPGFENNVFSPIVNLYEIGIMPVGFRSVNGNETFVIDIPVKTPEGSTLGCFAHGDKKIEWYHSWKEDCSAVRPVNSLVRIIR